MVFLGFILFHFGLAYLYLAFVEHFQIIEMYPTIKMMNFLDEGYFAISILSASLLLFVLLWKKFENRSKYLYSIKIRKFNIKDISLIFLFGITYYLALKFSTLAVGLKVTTILPFRLNGLIETICLFVIPFYIGLRSTDRFWKGLSIVSIYGLMNLVYVGSKFAALYPVVVFYSASMIISIYTKGKINLKQFIIPMVILLIPYTMINPYYFRDLMARGMEVNLFDALQASAETASLAGVGFADQILLGIRNISDRLVGITPMHWAMDIASLDKGITFSVTKFLNNNYLHTLIGSYAPGHFGFFIIFFGSTFGGILFALMVYLLLLIAFIRLGKVTFSKNILLQQLMGMTIFLSALPFFIDGNYDNISIYIKILFNVIVVYVLTKYFIKWKSL